jgi:hypothetical protein
VLPRPDLDQEKDSSPPFCLPRATRLAPLPMTPHPAALKKIGRDLDAMEKRGSFSAGRSLSFFGFERFKSCDQFIKSLL